MRNVCQKDESENDDEIWLGEPADATLSDHFTQLCGRDDSRDLDDSSLSNWILSEGAETYVEPLKANEETRYHTVRRILSKKKETAASSAATKVTRQIHSLRAHITKDAKRSWHRRGTAFIRGFFLSRGGRRLCRRLHCGNGRQL